MLHRGEEQSYNGQTDACSVKCGKQGYNLQNNLSETLKQIEFHICIGLILFILSFLHTCSSVKLWDTFGRDPGIGIQFAKAKLMQSSSWVSPIPVTPWVFGWCKNCPESYEPRAQTRSSVLCYIPGKNCKISPSPRASAVAAPSGCPRHFTILTSQRQILQNSPGLDTFQLKICLKLGRGFTWFWCCCGK